MPRRILSRRKRHGQISWGKLSRLPRTVAESTFASLDGYGLRGTLPARRRLRLVFVFVHRLTRLLDVPSDTACGGSPCTLLALHLHQVWAEDFHLQAAEPCQFTTNRSRGRALAARSAYCIYRSNHLIEHG